MESMPGTKQTSASKLTTGLSAPGIHGRFEAQVRATPNDLAVVDGIERLTYAELNERANRLAHHLLSNGAGPEVRVGLFLDSLSDRIVAVLGVLKAGGAYVPLEPSMPATRLEVMLDAARVSIVIVDRGAHPPSDANLGNDDQS